MFFFSLCLFTTLVSKYVLFSDGTPLTLEANTTNLSGLATTKLHHRAQQARETILNPKRTTPNRSFWYMHTHFSKMLIRCYIRSTNSANFGMWISNMFLRSEILNMPWLWHAREMLLWRWISVRELLTLCSNHGDGNFLTTSPQTVAKCSSRKLVESPSVQGMMMMTVRKTKSTVEQVDLESMVGEVHMQMTFRRSSQWRYEESWLSKNGRT